MVPVVLGSVWLACLDMSVSRVRSGTDRLYYEGPSLQVELRRAVSPFPFRGLTFNENVAGQQWGVKYKGNYLGRVPLAALNSAFKKLKDAQDNEKEIKKQEESTPARKGWALRLPKLLYFAVNEVVGDGMQGDLSAAEAAEELHADMFSMERGLWLASLQGKYGPWKDALWTVWQQWGPKKEAAMETRASNFWNVLQRATLEMSTRGYQDWSDHCGKNVAHHSGFLKLLIDLGLVQLPPPVKEAMGPLAKRRKGVSGVPVVAEVSGVPVVTPSLGVPGFHPLRLSTNRLKQNATHLLQTGLPSTLQRMAIEKYLATADALHRILLDAPRTCQEYIGAFKLFQEAANQHKPPHVNGSYTLPWTFRSAAYVRMRCSGVQALSGADVTSLVEFAVSFPDQNDWLNRLFAGLHTVQGAMNVLEYKGPPELLTMKLCLHLEPELMLYNAEWLCQNALGLHMGAQLYAKRLGFFPHIGVFLQLLRDRWEVEEQVWPKLSLSLEEDAWTAAPSRTLHPPSEAAAVPGDASATPRPVRRLWKKSPLAAAQVSATVEKKEVAALQVAEVTVVPEEKEVDVKLATGATEAPPTRYYPASPGTSMPTSGISIPGTPSTPGVDEPVFAGQLQMPKSWGSGVVL